MSDLETQSSSFEALAQILNLVDLVRIVVVVKLYSYPEENTYGFSSFWKPNILPLEIKYSSKIDICGCLRFSENYWILGCLENYWIVGGSSAKQSTNSNYVDSYSNSVSSLAENAKLNQDSFFQ